MYLNNTPQAFVHENFYVFQDLKQICEALIVFYIILQLNVAGLSKSVVAYKVYQTMFRIVKESETVDSRQHCFLLQSSGHEPSKFFPLNS